MTDTISPAQRAEALEGKKCPVCGGSNWIGHHSFGPTNRIYLVCLDCSFDEEAQVFEERCDE